MLKYVINIWLKLFVFLWHIQYVVWEINWNSVPWDDNDLKKVGNIRRA